MKKKILSMAIILILVLFLIGCASEDITNQPNTEDDIVSSDYIPDENISFSLDSTQSVLTFEENIASATNIVRAKYIGFNGNKGEFKEFNFEPIINYKGQIDENYFIVREKALNRSEIIGSETIFYEDTTSPYVIGEEYVLILYNFLNVYYDKDRYTPMREGLYIEEKSDGSFIVNGIDINTYLSLDNPMTYEALIAYITDIIEQNPSDIEYLGGYILSDDISEIVEQTPYIFKVKISELDSKRKFDNTERYYCLLTETFKGTVDNKVLSIRFSAGTVIVGNEYIVLLDDVLNLSSKKSLYSVEEIEKINEIISYIG